MQGVEGGAGGVSEGEGEAEAYASSVEHKGTRATKGTKRGRRQTGGVAVDWSLGPEDRQALQDANLRVPLEAIAFDSAMAYGQPRVLDEDLVRQRLDDLRGCPPWRHCATSCFWQQTG